MLLCNQFGEKVGPGKLVTSLPSGPLPLLAALVAASAGVSMLIVSACTPPLISSSSRPYTSWCRLIIDMASNLVDTTFSLQEGERCG